jgi:hypothetical protein
MSKLNKTMNLEIETTELDSAQIRLIKKINLMLSNMMVTDEESEYFNSSSELLKLVAQSVKDANFSKFWSENSNIKYADQALEYGVDSLSEDLSAQNLAGFDN